MIPVNRLMHTKTATGASQSGSSVFDIDLLTINSLKSLTFPLELEYIFGLQEFVDYQPEPFERKGSVKENITRAIGDISGNPLKSHRYRRHAL